MATQVLCKPALHIRSGGAIPTRKVRSAAVGTLVSHSETDPLAWSKGRMRNQHARTGTIMLTTALQLLHMDPQASYLSRLVTSYAGHAANGTLPMPILELCTAVRRHGNFQVHVVKTNGQLGQERIVLYGFEIPDAAGEPSRILILLKLIRQEEGSMHQAVERFGLTRREETVVRHLAMGYTNKEIANALCIAEQTVKEHMKHIMLKTGSSTRTGLLARVLSLGSRLTAMEATNRTMQTRALD